MDRPVSKIQAADLVCGVCREAKSEDELVPVEMIRPGVLETIRKRVPGWTPQGYVCLKDLNHYRSLYIQEMLESEKGELTRLESDVLRSLDAEELLSKNINDEFDRGLTLGERLADAITKFGGSWAFIATFLAFCLIWMGTNTYFLVSRPFDPYPYILLNLLLSCIAAIQAPVIIMSQKRQETRDRLRAEHDYRVNLKAELEIRQLHEKMDHLIIHQWQRLLDIQQIQTDLLEEIAPILRSVKGPEKGQP